MTPLVRTATRADEIELYALLIALHRHNDAGWGCPYDPQKVLSQIQVGTRMIFAERDNPHDERWGNIGVIGPHGGKLIGSVGLFVEPAAWFTTAVSLYELWLFVRPEERHRKLERALFAYANAFHDEFKATLRAGGYKYPADLQTGFVHRGPRFNLMASLWERASGAKRIGMLFAKP